MEIEDLPKKLVEVLYWRYKNLPPSQIKRKLSISPSTFFNRQKDALEKLGYWGKDANEMWKKFEEDGFKTLPQYSDEDIKNWEERRSQPKEIQDRPTQRQRYFLALMGVIALVIAALLIRRPPQEPEPTQALPVVPQVVTQVVVITATSEPTSETLPTIEPTLESTPDTLAVVSPEPTPILEPTPTVSNILFEDDYSDLQVAPEWDIRDGTPQITAGHLVTDSNLLMFYPDETLTDYEVEIGVLDAICCQTRPNFVAVRATDDRMVAIVFSSTGGKGWTYENGVWTGVPDSEYSKSARDRTFRVRVQGNAVRIYIAGEQVMSFQTDFPDGMPGLKIHKGTQITYFRVKKIQP